MCLKFQLANTSTRFIVASMVIKMLCVGGLIIWKILKNRYLIARDRLNL